MHMAHGAECSPPPSRPRMGSKRRIVFAFVAAGIGATAGLVVAELGARYILGTQYPLRFNCGVSESGVEARRGSSRVFDGAHYSFDAEGFRLTGPEAPHDYVVLFVGDSWTEGRGVDDDLTFAAVTQRELAKRGIRVRSLNAGMAGLGTAHELRLLRRLLDRRHVDAVVFEIFPLNDLDDDWVDGGFSVENGRLVEHDPPRPASWAVRGGKFLSGEWLGQYVLARVLANAFLGDYFAAPKSDATLDLHRLLLLEVLSTVRRHAVPVLMTVVGSENECLGRGDDNNQYVDVRALVRNLDTLSLDLCEVAQREDDFGTVDKHYSATGNARVGAALAAKLAPLLGRPTSADEPGATAAREAAR